MKRFAAVLLAAASLLLSGCSRRGGEIAGEYYALADSYAAQSARSGSYLLEITSEGGTAVYSASGGFECNIDAGTASTEFTQSWLGFSSKAANEFADGVLTTVVDGESESSERKAEELFAAFPYYAPYKFKPEDLIGAETFENAGGVVYTLRFNADREFYEKTVGTELYALVPTLKSPLPEKTVYGPASVAATSAGGKLTGFEYSFEVSLYDKPTYTPGYSRPESDFVTVLKVRANVRIS